MATYAAQDGYIGFAKQLVQGSYVNPTEYMKVLSAEFNPSDTKIMPDPEIGSGRDIDTVDQGGYKVAGTISTYIRQAAIVRLVIGALGGYAASGEQHGGEGDYLHVITPISSGSLPWMSLERQISYAPSVIKAVDMKVNQWSLKASPNEYLTSDFELVGISDTYSPTPSVPTFDTTPLVVGNGVTITFNGVTFSVKSLEMTLKNNLVDDDFRLGTRGLGDIAERRRELTLKMDVAFNPTDELYRKAFYGDAAASSAGYQIYTTNAVISFDTHETLSASGGNYRWTIELAEVVFMAAPVPTSGDSLVVVPLELLAIKGTGITNIIRVSVWNNKATYA